MTVVNMHEAKTQLSRLVERAARGEDIVIARAGRPAARLIAYEEPRVARVPGLLAGQLEVAEDFDITPIELIDAFEG
ncbi:MAG: type II toxin-antitoxin system Phd/YefM family antitoxin [Acidimicrobiia bacterium]